jgi:hypothetical protein
MEEARSKEDQDAALAAIRKVAPDIAAGWPAHRDLDATLAGIQRRRNYISRAWSWLGSYDIGREYADRLFGDVQAAVMPKLTEHAPGELGALVGTMSFTPSSHQTSARPWTGSTRRYISDSDGRYAPARSRFSSRRRAASNDKGLEPGGRRYGTDRADAVSEFGLVPGQHGIVVPRCRSRTKLNPGRSSARSTSGRRRSRAAQSGDDQWIRLRPRAVTRSHALLWAATRLTNTPRRRRADRWAW